MLLESPNVLLSFRQLETILARLSVAAKTSNAATLRIRSMLPWAGVIHAQLDLNPILAELENHKRFPCGIPATPNRPIIPFELIQKLVGVSPVAALLQRACLQ